ncbi:MAG: hypothetical protein ABFC84_08150 [Veillonellales bacterium]
MANLMTVRDRYAANKFRMDIFFVYDSKQHMIFFDIQPQSMPSEHNLMLFVSNGILSVSTIPQRHLYAAKRSTIFANIIKIIKRWIIDCKVK